MRIESVFGRNLLCGCILPHSKIETGQVWAPADGGKHTVTVIAIDGDWITYQGEAQPAHTKDAFSFQSQYCLVLKSKEIPEHLLPSLV